MSPKKQEPTNREALPWIIDPPSSRPTSLPGQICKQSNADAPKPPTYPFITFQFSKSKKTKFSGPPISWCFLQPCLQMFAAIFVAAVFRFRFAFPLVFRFGEAVFRPSFRKLQEEIFTSLSFSSAARYFAGENACIFFCAAALRRRLWGRFFALTRRICRRFPTSGRISG